MTPTEITKRASVLLSSGYYQVSRKFRIVARLPSCTSGIEALAEASGDRAWAQRLGEVQATDHYLRVYAKDCLTLDRATFVEFLRLGGGTRMRSAS